jgi:copper(I)-binding protein
MLLELERMPAVGEVRRLCLETEDGVAVCTSAAVRRDADDGDHHHHHH